MYLLDLGSDVDSNAIVFFCAQSFIEISAVLFVHQCRAIAKPGQVVTAYLSPKDCQLEWTGVPQPESGWLYLLFVAAI